MCRFRLLGASIELPMRERQHRLHDSRPLVDLFARHEFVDPCLATQVGAVVGLLAGLVVGGRRSAVSYKAAVGLGVDIRPTYDGHDVLAL